MRKLSTWTCDCGQTNQLNFCGKCGGKRPYTIWTCQCLTLNDEPICSYCGLSHHSETRRVCDHCGLELDGILNQKESLTHCPSCGDPITFYDQEWTL